MIVILIHDHSSCPRFVPPTDVRHLEHWKAKKAKVEKKIVRKTKAQENKAALQRLRPRVLDGQFCVSDRPPTKLATGNPSIDIFYNCNYKNYVSKSGTKWPSGSKVMAKTVSNVSLPF